MKNVASLALAVAALAVAVYAITQTTELGRELRNVKATLAARPASDTLDVQAKCARQATEAYKRLGLDQHPDACNFTNHYHAALGKCFIHTTDTTMTGPITTRWMNVTDAFEMREIRAGHEAAFCPEGIRDTALLLRGDTPPQGR